MPILQPAVHSIDHYAITVPDLAVAKAFYTDFGLEVAEYAGGLVLRAFGDDHIWGHILPGPAKRLHHLTFGIYNADQAAFERRLSALGIARVDAPAGTMSKGIWFRDFDGVLLQLVVGPKTSPNGKTGQPSVIGPASVRSSAFRSQASAVFPTRLSHVFNFTSDVGKAISFYEDAIGVRLSDRSGDDIAFLHAPHGSDHHLIAFARSGGPGFHHSSWDVPVFDDVGRGGHRMEALGYTGGWGVGRHVLGSNYFYYVRDPWGSWAEYSHDIDYVPSGHDWPAGDYASEDSLYQWGPDVPASFVTNCEFDAVT